MGAYNQRQRRCP